MLSVESLLCLASENEQNLLDEYVSSWIKRGFFAWKELLFKSK